MVDKKANVKISTRTSAERSKHTKKMDLGDVIKRKKEQCNKLNVKFNWQDLCQYIPECLFYRVDELRETAVKRQCSDKVIDQFLIFAFEQLINKDTLTTEKFIIVGKKESRFNVF
ncbi:hypothetical protein QLX08_005294 [Tetragonisca angustula]|uniref:Uncharacterized protein n=1 Tax=Tetragonisca angustula TaxID=166442 RepID=A0AAW0ZYV9_9HYME